MVSAYLRIKSAQRKASQRRESKRERKTKLDPAMPEAHTYP